MDRKNHSKLPKFKLVQTSTTAEAANDSTRKASPEAAAAPKPLELSRHGESVSDDAPLQQIDDILEHAYGAEKKSLRRKERVRRLKGISMRCLMALLFFGGTLIYAHWFAGIPILEPVIWYLPFFLSAVLSTWFYLQSARFWGQAYQLLAIFGLIVAGALVYWNVHVLRFAASNDQQELSALLYVPESVAQLYFSGEFDALRGVPESSSAYARMAPAVYRRAFHAIPRDQWRGHFQRYLSSAEMREINVKNIDEKMHEVTRRIAKKREANIDQLEAAIENPSFKFRIQQVLLRPYTWSISYLK